MDRLFEGVPVEIIVDDFLVHGKDQSEVDEKMRRVLDRSREVGLKFNPKKVKLSSRSEPCWTPRALTIRPKILMSISGNFHGRMVQYFSG